MSSIAGRVVLTSAQASQLPAEFLNAYEIENIGAMSWQVALYKLERLDGQSLAHSDRGKIKNILWELYKRKKSQCRGLGFVVDIAPDLAAVPIGWNLPSPEEFEDYAVYRQEEVQVSLANPRHHKIVVSLIREGLKRHFKNNNPAELGPLWQDYGRFCQQPQDDGESNASFCRRFDFGVKILRGQRVVIEFPITTTAVDNFSFADYYQNGEVDLLAEMIETKRADRVTRQNQPIATRVARYLPHPNNVIQEVLDLSQEATIFDDSKLTQSEQKKLTHKKLQCIRFPDTICDVPLYELRLILGSQNTQEDHTETIISPSEREALMRQLRNFIDGATIYGQTLTLSPSPFATADLEGGFVLPPAICVKGQNNKQVIIPAPIAISEVTLKERTRKRSQHIRQNGFLIQRPINPLLAYPRKAGKDSAERIQQDFNYLLEQQGIDYRFSMRGFDTVDKIRRTIEEEGYDSAVVVLPPNNNERVDLHEQVKQRLEVPSQCIMLKNIMPKKIECSLQELKQRDNRLARRIEHRTTL